VLRALIDARLLTSYELPSDDGPGRQRIEVIHESLISHWPRLVGWRTQDADSARLRDELRQAARQWHEHGRIEDRLWTGAAFKEYEVWRERYPGGLTGLEEAFAAAMSSLATRRRRRRRIAVAATFLILAGVLAVVGTSLRRTRAALTRTDASRLVALGRAVGVEADPTAVLAYAIASLERTDSSEARRLALDAIAHGPIRFVADDRYASALAFSPDGRWLVEWTDEGEARVWSREGSRSVFRVPGVEGQEYGEELIFPPDGSAVITGWPWASGSGHPPLKAWELPAGAPLGELEYRVYPRPPVVLASPGLPPRLAVLELEPGSAVLHTLPLRRSSAPVALRFDLSAWFRDPPTFEVEVKGERHAYPTVPAVDPMGAWLAVPVGREVVLQPLEGGAPARVLARHEVPIWWLAASPDGRAIAAGDEAGTVRLWSVATGEETARLDGKGDYGSRRPINFSADGASFVTCGQALRVWRLGQGSAEPGRTIVLPAGTDDLWVPNGPIRSDRRARWIAAQNASRAASVWNLTWPAEARPVTLRREPSEQMAPVSVHPDGTWVAASGPVGTAIWPLEERAARTLVGHGGRIQGLAFAPDSSWLASTSLDGTLRLWPLAGDPPPPARELDEQGRFGYLRELDASADGRLLALGTNAGEVVLVSTEGAARQLPGFAREPGVARVTLSDDGRLAAAGGASADEAFVRVWDLATGGEVARLDAGDRKPIWGVLFLADGGLVSYGSFGIRLHDVAAGSSRPLWVPDDAHAGHAVGTVRRSSADLLAFVLFAQDGSNSGAAYLLEPATGAARRLASHGDRVAPIALDGSGTVVATGSADGVVRVGPATGEEPHLLLGHETPVSAVAISPRGDWVASGGGDGTIRLWPVPDLSQPPAYTLPLPELLAKLEIQTNLRAVSDPAAPGGYRLVPGPFPGWANVPEWQP